MFLVVLTLIRLSWCPGDGHGKTVRLPEGGRLPAILLVASLFHRGECLSTDHKEIDCWKPQRATASVWFCPDLQEVRTHEHEPSPGQRRRTGRGGDAGRSSHRMWTGDHPDHSALLVVKDSDSIPWDAVGELTQEDAGADASTVVLVDSAGNRFTVSTDGMPYLVRVEMTQTTESGAATAEITFSDFGAVTETITAPTGDIVDLR